MFIGHYSAALWAKGVEPRVPLWAALVAAQLIDVVHIGFVAAGIERVHLDTSLPTNSLVLEFMPYTHSLVAALLWSVAAFAVWRLAAGWAVRVATVLAMVVTAHWLLDWLVHRPDLALFPGGVRYGLAIWNWPLAGLLLELGLLGAALAYCIRGWKPPQLARRHLLWLVLGLCFMQVWTLVGPRPETLGLIYGLLFVIILAVPWLGHRVEAAASKQ